MPNARTSIRTRSCRCHTPTTSGHIPRSLANDLYQRCPVSALSGGRPFVTSRRCGPRHRARSEPPLTKSSSASITSSARYPCQSNKRSAYLSIDRVDNPGSSCEISYSQPMASVMLHWHRVKHLIVFGDDAWDPVRTVTRGLAQVVLDRNTLRPSIEFRSGRIWDYWDDNILYLLPVDHPLTALPLTCMTTLVLYNPAFGCLSHLVYLLQNYPHLSHITLTGNQHNVEYMARAPRVSTSLVSKQ